MVEREDPWTAPDKVYHLLLCFTLTITFSLLVARFPHPFLRRRHLAVAGFLSLSVGAGKEFADHLGYFQSSGASFRDAVADVVGVLLAIAVSKVRCRRRVVKRDLDEEVRGMELV